ncbi:MAG: phosphate regulon sensor histidine kinase PhoR [Gammaproteobacteria bacterium]|nr:phosphate regulon sensor histidine kinase PhoR [Gammaproteobacteria bacterium]
MNPGWPREALRLLALLLAAFLASLLFRHMGLWLLLALSVYLAWHVLNLYRLERWLRRERQFNTPESSGIWAEVFNHFYRMRRRERERKRRLARLLREIRDSTTAMPDGIVILNRHSEIRWLNEAAGRLLGLRVPLDVGQRIVNLVRQPEFVHYLQRGNYEELLELPSSFVSDAHLTVHIVPYGREQRLLLIRDTTRLHRLEQTRREFVANASHELRTPLTVLKGYLETMLEEGSVQQAWVAPLEEMHRQTTRMTAIVNDLLELSRLETEQHEAPFVPIDVATLLERVRQAALTLGYGPRNITLEVDASLCLFGAENEIYSAFSNLAFNAVKYTPATGQVTLSWQPDREGACFMVEDTGIGILPEHIPRLTERFYRVDKSRHRDSGGTGLGLAIVKHVLQHHGAVLDIQSEPGRGSRFCCRFTAERVSRRTDATRPEYMPL